MVRVEGQRRRVEEESRGGGEEVVRLALEGSYDSRDRGRVRVRGEATQRGVLHRRTPAHTSTVAQWHSAIHPLTHLAPLLQTQSCGHGTSVDVVSQYRPAVIP